MSNSFLLADIYTMDSNRIILLWVISHGSITFLMGLSGLLDFPPRTRDKSWLWVTVWTPISLGVLLRWLWSSDQVEWLHSPVASHPCDWRPRLTAMVSIECHTLRKVYTTRDHFQFPWSKTYGKAPIWMCPIMQIKYPHTHLPWKTTEMLCVFTFVCFEQTSVMWMAEEGTEMEQFVGHVSLQSSLLWPRRLALTSSVSVRSSHKGSPLEQ